MIRAGSFNVLPLRTQPIRQWSLKSLQKTLELYLSGLLVRMTSKRMAFSGFLGSYRVGMDIIWDRLSESHCLRGVGAYPN